MIWEKTEISAGIVRETARQYGLDLLSASILIRRNLLDHTSLRFLLEDDLSILHSPFLFEDMGKAVDRILAAVQDGEKIHIYGDSDVDGITSTVLLFQTLSSLGARVQWQLPEGEEDYGLSSTVVQRLASEAGALLITVDCGISNVEEIALAAGRGIDTIVLDHHNPPEELPAALAVINPKCRNSKYPFRDLAGCGVVSKLALALALARTPLYNRPVWLLHAKPANAVLILEAVRLANLVPEERISDSIPEGSSGFERTRIYGRLAGQQVLVLERQSEARLLAKITAAPGFELQDLQPLLLDEAPHLVGKSLLWIKENEGHGRFGTGELDVLVGLYTRQMWKRHRLAEVLERVLDLAALGTIADLMPLVDENRIIVRRGLEVMGRFGRPGLRDLLIRQNLHGRRLTVKDISWQVAPVLNSAGRMGQPGKAAGIFLATDPAEIERLIGAVLELNDRRKLQGDRAWDVCYSQAYSSLQKSGGKLVFIRDDSIPRGITGILASRLLGFFKVPSLVVALGETKAVGSLRSSYPMDGFLDQFADLLGNYGGHDCAAGFTLALESVVRFETRLYLIAKDIQPPRQEEARILIDAEVPPAYLNPDLIKVVEFFEPFGEGSPPVTFLTRRVRIDSLEIVGRKEAAHVRMLLGAERYKWPAVYWNAAERAGKDFAFADTVDVVYRLGRNYFMNSESLQLTVIDLKR